MGRNRPVSHQKRMARVSLRKGGGPAGGSSFFTKRTWVRRATAGSWDRRGWPGRGRARAGGSGQGEAGRARLGPGTRPDEAPLQEETNRERVRLTRRDERQEAAMGSAGRSGSAATTRATSAQTDGAILADADGTATCLSHTRHGEGERLPGYRKGPTIRGWGGALPSGHQDERPSAGDKRGHVGAVIIDAARYAAGGPRAGLTPTPRHWLWTLVTFTPWPSWCRGLGARPGGAPEAT